MKRIAAVTLSLATVFGLAGCENAEEIARKSDIIDSFVRKAQEKCVVVSGDTTYYTRLRERLSSSYTASLEILRDNGTVICLDKRLSNLERDWNDARFLGVYDPVNKTLGIYDHGRLDKDISWHERGFSPGRVIYRLSDKIVDRKISTTEQSYAHEGSKGAIWWRSASSADQDTLDKNPALKQPMPMK